MELTKAWSLARVIDTQRGIDLLIDMIIKNDNYDAMSDVNVKLGKMADEVAKKHGIPFDFDKYYRHVDMRGEQ